MTSFFIKCHGINEMSTISHKLYYHTGRLVPRSHKF